MAILRNSIVILVFTVIATGCGPGLVARQKGNDNAFDPRTLDGNVRFEGVNSNGEFVTSETVKDPMRSSYEETIWTASTKSKVETIRSKTALNRINLVFVGDGYSQNELASYAKDVEKSTQQFFAQQPFYAYQNYFAVHRVDVVSVDNGITEERAGVTKKTALEMTFNCSGIARLLCANVNKVMQEAQNAPGTDIVFSMANSATYGGAGYMVPPVATFAGRNPASFELAMHEFAHSFAGLTDEYDSSGVPAKCTSFANSGSETESEMLQKKTKWYRWLDLPEVSSFRGSCYSLNYYRPTQNSKMRSLGRPFEPVNMEQFVIRFYKTVSPIEFATSPGGIGITGELEVVPMKPIGQVLKVEWAIDGVLHPGLTGHHKIFPKTLGLKRGLRSIDVTVTDTTPFVRDEAARKKYMTQSLNWKVLID